MSTRDSLICIAKDINMDRYYKNTLALSQNEIEALCYRNSVYWGANYSFIRTENRIKVQAPFSQIFPGNYCYIINQGVRQFFFVLDVKYVSDATTEIKVEEDVLTTYKDRGFNFAYCERQHPQTDEMYANTVSEPISPSNYRKNGPPVYLECQPTRIAAIFTEMYGSDGVFSKPRPQYNEFLKCATGLYWRYFELSNAGIQELGDYFGNYVYAGKDADLLDIRYIPAGMYSMSDPKKVTIPEPEGIQYHEPKNKKLYNYPYTFVQFSNNNGSVLQLKPELLESRVFKMVSIDNTGGTQAFAFPENYMGRMNNFDYGLLIDNFPHLELTSDSQLAWVGKTGREIKQGLVGKLVSAGLTIGAGFVGGGFAGGAIAGASVVGGAISDISEIVSHTDDTPDTVRGQSGGDYISQMCSKFNFRIENMSLPREQAEVVDDFFTRFGYAQSNTMPINVTNPRFHCHYVKTAPGECVIQGIPQEKADIINSAFNNGITFWDSNESFGNYDLKSANTR